MDVPWTTASTSLVGAQHLDDRHTFRQVTPQLRHEQAIAVLVDLVRILVVPGRCSEDNITVAQVMLKLSPSDRQVSRKKRTNLYYVKSFKGMLLLKLVYKK